MKIIIVRHGESLANSKNISQGSGDEWTDTPLTKKGKGQAKKVAERLKEEDIEVIYSSDLKRAKETAREIGKFHKVKVEFDPRIRDVLDEENIEEFISKIKSFFEDIEKEEKNAIVVAHGSSCLTLLAITTGSREEGNRIVQKHKHKQKNTCVSIVEKDDKNYKIKFIGCKKHLDG